MRCGARVGESRADEPGLGPGGSLKDAALGRACLRRRDKRFQIADSRLQIADWVTHFSARGVEGQSAICNLQSEIPWCCLFPSQSHHSRKDPVALVTYVPKRLSSSRANTSFLRVVASVRGCMRPKPGPSLVSVPKEKLCDISRSVRGERHGRCVVSDVNWGLHQERLAGPRG